MGPQDFSAANDWPGYFGAVLGKPPRDTLLAALAAFEQEGVAAGFAVDLAAGEGRDTLELLTRGWRVLATDAEPVQLRRAGEAIYPASSLRELPESVCQRAFTPLADGSFQLPQKGAPDSRR